MQLLEEEERRAKEVFEAYDYDGSGQIDKTEMRELLEELRWFVDSKRLDSFMDKVFSGSSEVTLKMFMELYKAVLSHQPAGVRKNAVTDSKTVKSKANRINIFDLRELESELRRLFTEMDEDGKGYLGVDEMRNVLRKSGLPDPDGDDYETAVTEHMQIADLNKDGQISFEEFIFYRNAMINDFYQKEVASSANADIVGDDDHQFPFWD
mmetsp:Transcript_129903/g.250525  ORF Transcript_129903/g.250525 Transcript_129903/m.250525 type:complete len:209 (+) Transcript_129903:54-680(+)